MGIVLCSRKRRVRFLSPHRHDQRGLGERLIKSKRDNSSMHLGAAFSLAVLAFPPRCQLSFVAAHSGCSGSVRGRQVSRSQRAVWGPAAPSKRPHFLIVPNHDSTAVLECTCIVALRLPSARRFRTELAVACTNLLRDSSWRLVSEV